MSEKIAEIIVPNYIDKIKISEARRAKYFISSSSKKTGKKKIPSKYFNESGKLKSEYQFDKEGYLILKSTKEKIIANPKAFGTPNFTPVKGNAFYSGFSTPFQRIAIVEGIKANFLEKFNEIAQLNHYPLYIEFIYCDELNQKTTTKGKKSQDLDNLRFAYEKCSLDLLKSLKKIVDDDLNYIRKVSSEFIEVPKDQKKLIISFYKYKPKIISNDQNNTNLFPDVQLKSRRNKREKTKPVKKPNIKSTSNKKPSFRKNKAA